MSIDVSGINGFNSVQILKKMCRIFDFMLKLIKNSQKIYAKFYEN